MSAPGFVTLAMRVTFLPQGRFSSEIGRAPFFVPCTCRFESAARQATTGGKRSTNPCDRPCDLAGLARGPPGWSAPVPSMAALPSAGTSERCYASLQRAHEAISIAPILSRAQKKNLKKAPGVIMLVRTVELASSAAVDVEPAMCARSLRMC